MYIDVKTKPLLQCLVVSICFIELNEVIWFILKTLPLEVIGKTE